MHCLPTLCTFNARTRRVGAALLLITGVLEAALSRVKSLMVHVFFTLKLQHVYTRVGSVLSDVGTEWRFRIKGACIRRSNSWST